VHRAPVGGCKALADAAIAFRVVSLTWILRRIGDPVTIHGVYKSSRLLSAEGNDGEPVDR
jgi:hypothetical protein